MPKRIYRAARLLKRGAKAIGRAARRNPAAGAAVSAAVPAGIVSLETGRRKRKQARLRGRAMAMRELKAGRGMGRAPSKRKRRR